MFSLAIETKRSTFCKVYDNCTYRVSLLQSNLVVGNARDTEGKLLRQRTAVWPCPSNTLDYTLVVSLACSHRAEEGGREGGGGEEGEERRKGERRIGEGEGGGDLL